LLTTPGHLKIELGVPQGRRDGPVSGQTEPAFTDKLLTAPWGEIDETLARNGTDCSAVNLDDR